MLVKISLVNSKELFHLGSIGTGDLFYKTNWPPASYLRDNSSVVFFPLEFTFKEEKTCLCFPTALANTLPSSCAGAPGQGKETRSVGWEVLILKSQTRKKTRPPHHHPARTRAETDTHGCNPGMNACTDTHTHTCIRRYARSKPPPRDVTWPGTLTNIQTHQAQTLQDKRAGRGHTGRQRCKETHRPHLAVQVGDSGAILATRWQGSAGRRGPEMTRISEGAVGATSTRRWLSWGRGPRPSLFRRM